MLGVVRHLAIYWKCFARKPRRHILQLLYRWPLCKRYFHFFTRVPWQFFNITTVYITPCNHCQMNHLHIWVYVFWFLSVGILYILLVIYSTDTTLKLLFKHSEISKHVFILHIFVVNGGRDHWIHITVECRHNNPVQYKDTLHTALQQQGQNMKWIYKKRHILPSRASYDTSFARFLENWPR